MSKCLLVGDESTLHTVQIGWRDASSTREWHYTPKDPESSAAAIASLPAPMPLRPSEVCKYFSSAHGCKFASRCKNMHIDNHGRIIHTAPDQAPLHHTVDPNLIKTRQCIAWHNQGKCRYGSGCRYAHGLEEQRRHPASSSSSTDEAATSTVSQATTIVASKDGDTNDEDAEATFSALSPSTVDFVRQRHLRIRTKCTFVEANLTCMSGIRCSCPHTDAEVAWALVHVPATF